MPIYEFKCALCNKEYEVTTLRISEACNELCPNCGGLGTKLISAPAIVYEIGYNERAVHKLPDWKQKQAQAQQRDTRLVNRLKPLPDDMGKDIKVYDTNFGRTERRILETKAQLDNL